MHEAAQRGRGASFPADIHHSTGHGPEKADVIELDFSRRLDKQTAGANLLPANMRLVFMNALCKRSQCNFSFVRNLYDDFNS